MDRIIYTAMAGAARILEQQAVLSNNMANLGTTGFRGQLAIYRSVPLVGGQELPTRVTTVTSDPGSSFEQGVMEQTGHALDTAITGPGWFAVRTRDGEAYTRAGEFTVNTHGELVTAQGGLPVLSADGAVVEIPARGSVTFTSDGLVTVLGAGDSPKDVQVLGQLKLVNPPVETMKRGADGLFRSSDPAASKADPNVRIVAGFIEKSNVSAAQAMVGMIDNARHLEMQMNVIRDTGSNEERANSILSVNG